MRVLLSWVIMALAIGVTAYILPGVTVSGFGAAMVTALILTIVNVLIRPLLIFITLPINILTLGLFTLVINALMVLLVAAIVPGFKVRNFWWALLFAIILALINGIFQAIVF